MSRRSRLILALIVASVGAEYVRAADTSPAEVIVLSTLHQFHGQTDGYSFEDLSNVIEQLHPDIIAVELTAADVESRREQTTKQEYQRSVFPLLDKHDYVVVALEPPQPLYDELVGLFRKAQQELGKENPAAAETFGIYVDSLYEILWARWNSPGAVNSRETDALFESKHRFQSAILGPDEAKAWEQWNQHFLQQVLNAANANPGKRILVLVGVEHAYWLRARFSRTDIVLLDTKKLLDGS